MPKKRTREPTRAEMEEAIRRITMGREQLHTEAQVVCEYLGKRNTVACLLSVALVTAIEAEMSPQEFDDMFHLLVNTISTDGKS